MLHSPATSVEPQLSLRFPSGRAARRRAARGRPGGMPRAPLETVAWRIALEGSAQRIPTQSLIHTGLPLSSSVCACHTTTVEFGSIGSGHVKPFGQQGQSVAGAGRLSQVALV